jgi:Pyridoxal-dependent decarboxylase conserved domain
VGDEVATKDDDALRDVDRGSIFRGPLEIAAARAMSYLSKLDETPVGATADPAVLRTQIAKPLSRYGLPAEQVVSELAADVAGGLHGVASGRFFAWVIGGSVPAALGADWLTSAWDQNAHNYGTGPAAAIAEEVVGGWLKEIFDLPRQSSFALVTGCQMAHFTCLASARHALLAKRAWNVEVNGMSGAPPIRVMSSDQAHGSIERAVSMLGIGTSNFIKLSSDSSGRLDAAALESALAAESNAPTVVVMQAGDLNIGGFTSMEHSAYGLRPARLIDTCSPASTQRTLGRLMDISGSTFLMTAAMPSLRIRKRMLVQCPIGRHIFPIPRMRVTRPIGTRNGRVALGVSRAMQRSGNWVLMEYRK